MIKQKKAGVFAIGMVIAMILFMTAAWFAFTATNNKITFETRALEPLMDYNNEYDRFIIYRDESAKMAASQAFYEIARDAGIDKNQDSCTVYNNYFILSDNCKPGTNAVRAKFIDIYNRSFNNLMSLYPQYNFRNNIYSVMYSSDRNMIEFKTDKIKPSSQVKTDFAVYNLSYEVDPSATVNLSEQDIILEDFEEIYLKIINAKNSCVGREITSCMKSKLEFVRWHFDAEKQGSHLIIKMKTKSSYFYQDATSDERFAPVEFNFAIQM